MSVAGPSFIRGYLVGPVLGEGTYGRVRECVDEKSLRRVAVKILLLSQVRRAPGGLRLLEREVRLHSRLKHVNIVEVVESFYDDEHERLFIVQELVNGGTVEELLDEQPNSALPPSAVRWYARQLLQGLEYMHGKGVVHRDIKPSNLMLTTDGVLKIADFGVAEELDAYCANDSISATAGTPAFLPPEVASGKLEFSGMKTDVWAAGVTLYRMAVGRMPFGGRTIMELLTAIAECSFEIPDSVEDGLRDLITVLMNPDEDARATAAQARRHRWLKEEIANEKRIVQPLFPTPHVQQTTIRQFLDNMYGADDGLENEATASVERVAPEDAHALSKEKCSVQVRAPRCGAATAERRQRADGAVSLALLTDCRFVSRTREIQ